MCACTEPVRTGIGALCVEYGRPQWPITMLNHTHNHTYIIMFCFLFLAPYARTTRYEEAVFSLENQGKKGSLRSRASLLIINSMYLYWYASVSMLMYLYIYMHHIVYS